MSDRSPSDLTSSGVTAQQWLSKDRRHQIIEEEQELRTEARSIPTRSIEGHDNFSSDLPRRGNISEAGVHGCRRLLTSRAVKPELDEWHELIERFILRPARPGDGAVDLMPGSLPLGRQHPECASPVSCCEPERAAPFGAHVLERFHLEVSRSHPRIYRAEWMLDHPSTQATGSRADASKHGFTRPWTPAPSPT